MPKLTQREMLEAALRAHGCKEIRILPSGWGQWSTGDLTVPSDDARAGRFRFFWVGKTGFRSGPTRTESHDWPALRARLMAQRVREAAKPVTNLGF